MSSITQTYRLRLDSGHSQDIRAESAGEAIYLACQRNRGQRVTECVLGASPPSPKPSRKSAPSLLPDENPGLIRFDVPSHEALPKMPSPGRQRLCAKYLRIGCRLEDGPYDFEVIAINQLPRQLKVEVRNLKYPERISEIKYLPDELVMAVL